MHRWVAAGVALLALVALACKAGTGGGPPGSGGDLPSSMVALGDSITAGYGSCLAPTACPRNSWSTGDGTQVNSHYRRIRAENPAIRGHARNLSVPGATSADLPRQAAAASTVEYVTVLIGANDACRGGIDDMTPVDTFRGRLDAALDTLGTRMPKADVLVVSIPDVYRVWEVGHNNAVARRIWAGGVCPALLANPTSTAQADRARRETFRNRVDAYNRELSAACRAHDNCRYDGGAAHEVKFGLDQLTALDFFHPNAAGQNKLAAVTWSLSG